MAGRKGVGLVVLEACESNSDDKYWKCEASQIKNSYPLKFLIPKHVSETNCRWIYPISYGGGLVEGDQIEISVVVKERCSAVVTSQESTKVYECSNDIETSQSSKYTIEDGGQLCVLPDPVVCYKSANFVQTQEIWMSSGSNLVFLDWLIAGRIARGESWQFTSFRNKFSIFVDDELVLNEVCHLENSPSISLEASMKTYQISGVCVILGKNVDMLATSLMTKYGRHKEIGEVITKEALCSISKLEYTINNKPIAGCYLRFLTTKTKAYDIINDITRDLIPVIGSDPFNNKN